MPNLYAAPKTASCRQPGQVPAGARLLPLAALLLAPLPVLALSVGTPRLLSAYAQPLRVEVPVSLAPDERAGADQLRVEMLPESQYGRYGVAEQPLSPSLVEARFDPASGLIEIDSTSAIEEPAAILLLQVSLGGTRIIKEVPLLFDLPTQQRSTAAAPAAAASAAIDAGAAPVAPAAAPTISSAPVAAPLPPAAVAAAPAPHRAHRRRETASRTQPPAPQQSSLFHLSAGLQLTAPYTSASAGLRLAESFDSYAEFQRSQPAPPAAPAVPAVQAMPAPQPVPMPAPAPQPVKAAAAPPRALPPPVQRSGLLGLSAVQWLVLLAILGAAAWWLLRPRRRAAPAPAAVAMPQPAPMPVPQAAVATAPEADPNAPLRERLRRLTRGKLDSDLARRALLVEAFLDLRRGDSAARLLEEMERDIAAATPRGGADIAAAVRR